MFPKYIIKRSINNQYYWDLFSVNGQVLITSETYTTKEMCIHGINASKIHIDDRFFLRAISSNFQNYFDQKASNGFVLGRSQMYTTAAARDNGIEAVKRDAPRAEIEDSTVSSFQNTYR